MTPPFFSLILGTMNRHLELEICLDSLLKQVFKQFEIVVVDQSNNSYTEDLLKLDKYKKLQIMYKRVTFKGLSKARNCAIKLAKGKYGCLIDDDAAYDVNYLQEAYGFLKGKKNVILSGYIWNPIRQKALPDYAKAVNEQELSVRQIIRMCPSPGLIFPMTIFGQGIIFDELLGVGGKFGACEETDVVLQFLDQGIKVFYIDKMRVIHPTIAHSFEVENASDMARIKNYARGMGALLKKDLIGRKNKRLLPILLEKQIKISIKTIGVLGKDKAEKAKIEWIGMKEGYHGYIV